MCFLKERRKAAGASFRPEAGASSSHALSLNGGSHSAGARSKMPRMSPSARRNASLMSRLHNAHFLIARSEITRRRNDLRLTRPDEGQGPGGLSPPNASSRSPVNPPSSMLKPIASAQSTKKHCHFPGARKRKISSMREVPGFSPPELIQNDVPLLPEITPGPALCPTHLQPIPKQRL